MFQLRKIYNNMTFEEAIKLFTKKVKTGLSESQVKYCYGMSKMTIMDEMRKSKGNTYSRLQFVEFLEFLGRIANYMIFKHDAQIEAEGDEDQELEFSDKIRRLLEMTFQKFNMEYKEPVIEEEFNVESDFISNDNLSDF